MNELLNVNGLTDIKQALQERLENIAARYVEIGYLLKRVKNEELYKEDGCADVYEFAQKNFNISTSWAIRWMQINDTYSVGGNSPELEPKYIGYGSSKLAEMLPLPEEVREAVPITATVQDVRTAKRITKETENQQDPQTGLFDVEPETIDWMAELAKQIFRDRKAYQAMYKAINAGKGEDEALLIINPTKFRMERLTAGNVMLREDSIKVMPHRGGQRENYSYMALIKAFLTVFAGDPAEAYERVYGEPLNDTKKEPEKPANTKREAKLTPKPEKTTPKPTPEPPESIENTKVKPDFSEAMNPPTPEPEKPTDEPEEMQEITEEVVQTGRKVSDILQSGDLDLIKKAIMIEFSRTEAEYREWLEKVINI